MHVRVDNWRGAGSIGMREGPEKGVADEGVGPGVVVYEEGEGSGSEEVVSAAGGDEGGGDASVRGQILDDKLR